MKKETNPAYKLIETGSLITFKIINSDLQPTVDNEDLAVTVDLQMTDEDGESNENSVEWGAFGFIFVIAVLSFSDARPRGHSDIDFVDADDFTVSDFFDCIEFTTNGELRFYADYVSGRCLKTGITIRKDGSVTINTINRGKALIHWLNQLKGKKNIQVVK